MAGRAPIKIYTDENVNVHLVEALRQRGYDAQTTQEAENFGATDEEQLEYAVREEAVFLTHNIKHFERLHAKFLQYMTNFLERSTKEQMIGKLCHLEEFK